MKQITEGDILDAAIKHVNEKHPDCIGDKPLQRLMKAKLVMAYMDSAEWMQEQLKPEWVPVSERLPEIGQYVQAAIKGGVLLYSCVLEKNNTWYGYGYAQPETRITHWQPLPNGPEQ